jgi:hypothetical protein
MFSEASVLTRVTRCNIPIDVRHSYRRENIPKDGVLRPYTNGNFVSCVCSLFCACPSNKHCPSARCACAANVAVGKDLDIFSLSDVSLNYIYAPNCK